jgi:hypothetical protein
VKEDHDKDMESTKERIKRNPGNKKKFPSQIKNTVESHSSKQKTEFQGLKTK